MPVVCCSEVNSYNRWQLPVINSAEQSKNSILKPKNVCNKCLDISACPVNEYYRYRYNF